MRHILSLSGGKDSTALALYLKDKVPDLEYVFCDTGAELVETYQYLDKLEQHIGRTVVRLSNGTLEEHIAKVNGFLPSPFARWCTRLLKIVPFERYLGTDQATVYIGIRADETERKGNFGTKPNVTYEYPFLEDGIDLAGVHGILETGGIGMPSYYQWRSRSGCFCCFFQRKAEWLGLLKHHPDLFDRAAAWEKGEFTWRQGRSLAKLRQEYENDQRQIRFEMEPCEEACLICSL